MIGLASCSQSRRLKAQMITGPECRGEGNAAEQVCRSISSVRRSLMQALRAVIRVLPCEGSRVVGPHGNSNEDAVMRGAVMKVDRCCLFGIRRRSLKAALLRSSVLTCVSLASSNSLAQIVAVPDGTNLFTLAGSATSTTTWSLQGNAFLSDGVGTNIAVSLPSD
jgi:hypothetical protein